MMNCIILYFPEVRRSHIFQMNEKKSCKFLLLTFQNVPFLWGWNQEGLRIPRSQHQIMLVWEFVSLTFTFLLTWLVPNQNDDLAGWTAQMASALRCYKQSITCVLSDNWKPRLARLDQSGYINAWIGRNKMSWIQVGHCKQYICFLIYPLCSIFYVPLCVATGWPAKAHPATRSEDAGSECKTKGQLHHILHSLLQLGPGKLDHIQRENHQRIQSMF